MLYLVVGVLIGTLLGCSKGVTSHEIEALWRETVAQEVVDKEVVQLVGANQVFSFLLDITSFVGRNKFGRDGCIDDIVECGARFVVVHGLRHMAHQVPNEGFGYANVHGIHAHVVAIVCGPAQRQFRKVARSHNNTALFIP